MQDLIRNRQATGKGRKGEVNGQNNANTGIEKDGRKQLKGRYR